MMMYYLAGPPRAVHKSVRFPFMTHRAMSETLYGCHRCGGPLRSQPRNAEPLCEDCKVAKGEAG